MVSEVARWRARLPLSKTGGSLPSLRGYRTPHVALVVGWGVCWVLAVAVSLRVVPYQDVTMVGNLGKDRRGLSALLLF